MALTEWFSNRIAKLAFAPKDWITTTISLLALVVASTTAYVNLLRQRDDIRLSVPEESPAAYIAGQPGSTMVLTVARTQQLFLVNSGNRTAIVTSAQLLVQQPRQRSDKCEKGGWSLVSDFQPQVIKPGEAVSVEVAAREVSQGMDAQVPIEKEGRTEEYNIIVCLEVEVVTPSGAKQARIPLSYWRYYLATKGSSRFDPNPERKLIPIYQN